MPSEIFEYRPQSKGVGDVPAAGEPAPRRRVLLARPWSAIRAWLLSPLACVVLLGVVVAPLAAVDFDKIRALAQQRYGQRAADTVVTWRRLVAEGQALPDAQKLTRVNTFFNRLIRFESDLVVWNQADYWATPLELIGKGAGDCEDFVIAKYITLKLMGVHDEQLRLIYVRALSGSSVSEAHMVLGFYAQPTAEPMVLDNLISSVRPASQRSDLVPVFSFNAAGLWVGGAGTSSADPTARLSRWRDLLERMRKDGL